MMVKGRFDAAKDARCRPGNKHHPGGYKVGQKT
jgi:hypothetical protein